MMKIETRELEDRLILNVQGRLSGAYVPELEASWQRARRDRPDRKVSLDLTLVTCVDLAGRYLIQLMCNEGVDVSGASLALRDMLEPSRSTR